MTRNKNKGTMTIYFAYCHRPFCYYRWLFHAEYQSVVTHVFRILNILSLLESLEPLE